MDHKDSLQLKELARQYGISVEVPEPDDNGNIDDDRKHFKEFYRCLQLVLTHEDHRNPASIDEVGEQHLNDMIKRVEETLTRLQHQLDEVHQLKHQANQLGEKFMAHYESYLEHRKRYQELLVDFRQPYDRAKEDVALAKLKYEQEIARLGSLEEKWKNRDRYFEMRRQMQLYNEEEAKIDREIEKTKVKIRQYQSLAPELLDEYKRLKGDLEMRSLLMQCDVSTLSIE